MPHTLARSRRPHLLRTHCLLDYTDLDILDACTPFELHTASYGRWLAKTYQIPGWDPAQSKTLLITAKPLEELRDELEQAMFPRRLGPGEVPWVFARTLSGNGRVLYRARAFLLQGLPRSTAIYLSMQGAITPVIHAEGVHAWEGWAFPVLGPSFRVNLLSPAEVANALKGYLMELEVPGAIIEAYGFNPIPEFKRLFEARQ